MDAEVDWGMEDDFDPWQAGSAPQEKSEQTKEVKEEQEKPRAVEAPPKATEKPKEEPKIQTEQKNEQIRTAVSEVKPSVSTETPLPPDWITKNSRKHEGKTYYYNTVTKEVSWARPMPVEPEPETPPLPTQDLPDVEPIPGQESARRRGSSMENGQSSGEGKNIPENRPSSTTESPSAKVEADVSADSMGPDDPTSPPRPESSLPGQRADGRSRQTSNQSDLRRNGGGRSGRRNGKRGRHGLDRRDNGYTFSGPPEGSGPSNRNYPPSRSLDPPLGPRPIVGESRRRDQPDDLADDRGSSKRMRVDPDTREQAAVAPSGRAEGSVARTALPPTQPRADGSPANMDRRDQQSRPQEPRGPRQPGFLSGVNATPVNMRTFGAPASEAASREITNERTNRIPDRTTPASTSFKPSPVGPVPRDSDRSFGGRRGDYYRPEHDVVSERAGSARGSTSSVRDPPPHRETVQVPPRNEERSLPEDLRSRLGPVSAPRDFDREDRNRSSVRNEVERPEFGRSNSRQDTSTPDRPYEVERRKSRPREETLRMARYSEDSRSGRRSPPHLSRSGPDRYPSDVRQSGPEIQHRDDLAATRSHDVASSDRSGPPPAPASTTQASARAVPFVHPSRAQVLGVATVPSSPSPMGPPSHPRGPPARFDRGPPSETSRSSANAIPVNGRPSSNAPPPLARGDSDRTASGRQSEQSRQDNARPMWSNTPQPLPSGSSYRDRSSGRRPDPRR